MHETEPCPVHRNGTVRYRAYYDRWECHYSNEGTPFMHTVRYGA